MVKKSKKHLHIIGICGVTMAPLAVLYRNMGWNVTGSDKAFFPPMSTYLEKNKIFIMPGFKKEHLDSKPDLVLSMAFITKSNPEIIEAKRLKIPIKPYGEILPDLIEKKNSIVVAGDCGKTSTTSLLAWLLESAGHNPNFMIGGLPNNFSHGIRKTDSDWSVIEGDEYVVSSWNNTPRFLFYNPRYLVLTDITWDHMDKFTSEAKYINIFKELVKKVPEDGVIVANKKSNNIYKVLKVARAPIVFYSAGDFPDIPSTLKGDIWRQNVSAAAALARSIGIENSVIKKSLASFKGIKRRQEVRINKKDVAVIDDNAHTPGKVKGALGAVSEMLPGYKLCAIYEPGNRSNIALTQEGYEDCFAKASAILLPRVSSLSQKSQNFNERLAKNLKKYYKNCHYIEDDGNLVEFIRVMHAKASRDKNKIAFVFMSQKGFRGMIDQTITFLLR